MKKILPVISVIIIAIMTLSVQITADESDFLIKDGVLTEYKGSAADVSVPESVIRIQSGAFKQGTVSSVTIPSKTCAVDADALPSGITVYGYSGSPAETAANSSGNKFVPLDNPVYHTLTINYVYADGASAASSYIQSVEENSSYSVNSPNISGYTPDRSNVSGTMGSSDVTVKVIYKKNIASGWKVEGRFIRYYDSSISSYLVNTSRTIDGVYRSFDGNGNLVLSGDFVTVGSSTYYLVNNAIFSGYTRIGDGIYCFDSSGAMLKNKSQDGYTFDSSGRMTSTRQLITLSGSTYYLVDNTLFSGYCMIDGSIYCFGADYAMKAGGSYDGYTFDSNGRMTSGISASSLDVRYTPSLTFNGMAQKPDVEVYFNGLKLTEGVHYSISYANNITPGTGSIILTGISVVSGTSEWNFEITGKDSYILTITYVDSDGEEIYEPYVLEMKPGEDYYVVSPEIDGYKPGRDIVTGTMGYEDVNITVTYKDIPKTDATDTDKTGNETESDTEKSDETEYQKKVRVTYSYNYKLWFTVLIIATVIAAGAIVIVIKNKQIKKAAGQLIFKITGKSSNKNADKTADDLSLAEKGSQEEKKAPLPEDQSDDMTGKTQNLEGEGTAEHTESQMPSAGKRPTKRYYYKKK